jgi:hypothetical protein
MKHFIKNTLLLSVLGLVSLGVNAQKYIDVCGTRWALGNLQYDATASGENYFQSHWKMASNQWEYFNPVSGISAQEITQSADQLDHFCWGVVGDYATDGESVSNALSSYDNISNGLDISGKLYSDDCITRYTNADRFNNSSIKYGDLAYWATKGQYRLPNRSELATLINEANWQLGYYKATDSNNNQLDIYGYLFTTPSSSRTTSNTAIQFYDDDLASGLFLPLAGRGVMTSKRVGERGYYLTSGYYPESEDLSAGLTDVVSLIRLDTNAAQWSFWSPDYGCSIRGVMNFIWGDANGDWKVDISDLISIINYILGETTEINSEAADLSQDGTIGMTDIISELNLLLGQE